ncbi:MAG: MFS transporter [Chloroflexi bacterium]|nr:MFS transporter [Chloroflexota bacterium]
MGFIPHRITQSFASLGQRSFRYLTFSSAALGFGQWVQRIGMGWLVLEVTGSATQLGVVTFLQGIMILAASIPAGVLADRYNRRNVLVWTTAVGVIQALALAMLVETNLVELWHLYAFSIVSGLTSGVTQPVRQALVYDLTRLELLTNAMTVNSLAQNLARVTGPPLAGAVLGLFGTASTFFVLTALKLLAMALTMAIQVQETRRPGPARVSALTSLVDGLRYSLSHPVIRALIIATSVAPLLVYPYIQFLPIFARDVLHGGPETFGILATGVGWGSLIGLSVLAYLGDVRRKGLVFLGAHFVYIALVGAFARADWLPLSMAFLVGAGVCNSISGVLSNTLFQLASSNEMRGRVMALHSMSGGIEPVGALAMGLAIEQWNAPDAVSTFMLAGMAGLGCVALLFPALRRAELRGVPADEQAHRHSGLPAEVRATVMDDAERAP